MSRIRAMLGKEKEMIRLQLTVFFKSKYQDHSMWSFNYKQHIALACPYKTWNNTVKRQP
jgi:hypothetical protein